LAQARPSRLRIFLFGPQPSYPGDLFCELARESRRAALRSLLVIPLAVAAGLALATLAPSLDWRVIGFAIALVGPISGTGLVLWWLMRRRARPVSELLLWWVGAAIHEWQSIDGGDPPATPDEALSRLAGKEGDAATVQRLWALLENGDHDAVRTGLHGWQPSDPVSRARHERLQSALAFAEGVDDLEPARAAAEAVPDSVERLRQGTLLAIEEARRWAIQGRDPLQLLVDARRRLGPIVLPPLPLLAKTQRALGPMSRGVFQPSRPARAWRALVRTAIVLLALLVLYQLTAGLLSLLQNGVNH
jgi:hypothetical protein